MSIKSKYLRLNILITYWKKNLKFIKNLFYFLAPKLFNNVSYYIMVVTQNYNLTEHVRVYRWRIQRYIKKNIYWVLLLCVLLRKMKAFCEWFTPFPRLS